MPPGKYDWSKPLGQRRPKVMERMPDPPPLTCFEVDEAKLRQATEPNDLWLEEWPGKAFLWLGYAILCAIGLLALAGVVLLAIWSTQFRLGLLVVIVILIICWMSPDRPSKGP